MSAQQSENSRRAPSGSKRKIVSSLLFVVGMAAIFGVAMFMSRLDRPPSMPATEEHTVTEKKPNAKCLVCHTPESLPKKHPLDYEKFACTRCHLPAGMTNDK